MSDGYQMLCFDTIKEQQAQHVTDATLSWMKEAGFIASTTEYCVYDGDGHGYRPGPNWVSIVDDTRRWRGLVRSDDFIDSNPPPGARPYKLANFLELTRNGVHARVGREVCGAGENVSAFTGGICPSCKNESGLNVEIGELAADWHFGAEVTVECSRCGSASRLEDWDFQPFWAFAEAALTFWNWPPLSEPFVRDLARQVSVPRLRHIVGHL
jgi:hypothetical protein